ncbi:MAG TPA: hypothetical protein VEA36_02970, partial [Candidatus Paceibacterota bacterium]|nr:hypothetical protein [Candidatus Paceibacterota bacterium]
MAIIAATAAVLTNQIAPSQKPQSTTEVIQTQMQSHFSACDQEVNRQVEVMVREKLAKGEPMIFPTLGPDRQLRDLSGVQLVIIGTMTCVQRKVADDLV